jgi:hypothetical protein
MTLVLSQMNPVHNYPFYFLKYHFIFCSRLSLNIVNSLLPSCIFSETVYSFLFFPMLATCPVYLVYLCVCRYKLYPCPRLCTPFCNVLLVYLFMPNSHSGGLNLVTYPLLLLHYICVHPSYLEAISIGYLRTFS